MENDFKPYCIDWDKTYELREECDTVDQYLPDHWQIFAVDQKNGKTYYDKFTVTVPTWVWDKPEGKLIWYISHELAHVVGFIKNGCTDHGSGFQEALKEICPEEHQHHEYEYKPSRASSAGVSRSGE